MKKYSRTKIIVYIALATALIAVCSWITVPIGPIPVTLQTMAVFITVGLLGWKYGSIAVALYLFMGALGLPVFANFSGGLSSLLGVTGGYLLGFLFTSLISGLLLNVSGENLIKVTFAFIAGLALCYLFGSVWFYVIYLRNTGAITFGHVISTCVLPFIIPDLLKIAVAATVTVRLKKYII